MKLKRQHKPKPETGLNPRGKRRKRMLLWSIAAVASVLIGIAVACLLWYQSQLRPADPQADRYIAITIQAGMTPDAIGELLEEQGVIRNDIAFNIYTRLTSARHRLQAGSYKLTPAESTPQIVDHLVSGRVEQMSITFYPGAVLADNTASDSTTDVTSVLIRAGFSEDEIKAALQKQYDHPVFEGKPANMDIEGYVYGETYQFNGDATVEDILIRTFDQLHDVIQRENLKDRFAARGLTLYQGITLASIIQKEARGGDEAQIAQVFFKRLGMDMALGADATYQYIADKLGVQRDTNLDSPYNTRRYQGLPPGPISAPGSASLLAVANPADGDYLYYLHGDDQKPHFSYTLAEHEANIRNYCQIQCQFL